MSDKDKYDFQFENFEQIIGRIKKEYTKQNCVQSGITWSEFMTTTMALIRNKLAAGERFEDIKLAGYLTDEEKPKKKKKVAEKDGEPIITSLYVDKKNNKIVEQIFDGTNRFCIHSCDNNTVSYSDEYNDGYINFKPINDEEVFKKAILLPSKAEEYGTDTELDTEIRNYINEWLDVPGDICQFAIWNIKRSWVYDKFHTLNYLRALGDTGQGKSRFLDTLGSIHYKPIATSGATTAAPIFRIINKWKGTLIMDEADFQKSDESQDIIKIINQGYERGRFIMRCDKENLNKVDFFDPFCPKILATRKPFYDKAVESRCITQVMVGTKRKNISWNLNDKFWQQAQTIRNKLLMWRFRNYFKVELTKEIDLNDLELEPRMQQIVGSFVGLFCNDNIQMEQFKIFIKKYQEDLIDERRSSFTGEIVTAIHNLIEGNEFDISANDIIESSGLTGMDGKLMKPRALSSHLKSLGFDKAVPRRTAEGTKRCIPLELEHLNELFKRYGVTVVTHISQKPPINQNDPFLIFSTPPLLRNDRNTVTKNDEVLTENDENQQNQPKSKILTILTHLHQTLDIIPLETALKLAQRAKIEEKEFEIAITALLKEGNLYSPKNGYLKVLE